jgi:hypothetical protein
MAASAMSGDAHFFEETTSPAKAMTASSAVCEVP